jgi:hypothetical protein
MTLQEIQLQFALQFPESLVQLFQNKLLGDFQSLAPGALVNFADDFEPLSLEPVRPARCFALARR